VTPGTTATSYRDLLLAEIHERAPLVSGRMVSAIGYA
jgi:hypothetical protein